MIDIGLATAVDLLFSKTGDFQLKNGDFETTENTLYGGIIQDIEDRVKSQPGDWLLQPRRGCALSDSIGQPNNPRTHSELEQAIKIGLVHDLFLRENDFEVIVAPVSRSTVAIRIDLALADFETMGFKTMKVVYDLDGQGPYIGRN
jgi:hypothetical protein